MIGRLGLYDGLDQRWTYVKVNKDPNCPVCGDNPTITELIDYEEFCGMPAHDREEDEVAGSIDILPVELAEIADKPDVVLLDVREPHEWDIAHLDNAVLIPKDTVPSKLSELDPTKEYIVYCKAGPRSSDVTRLMRGAGFKARNLWGGINAYARQVDDSIPTY